MRVLSWALKGLLALFLLALVGVTGWLALSPPELIRLGTAYTAKIVCSNRFLAGRDGDEVLRVDVQAPGHPLLGYMSIDVDDRERKVAARLLGTFAEGRAIYRDGTGCVTVPDGDDAAAALPPLPARPAPDMTALWPAGEKVEPSHPALAGILDDPDLTGPGMRAVVVVHDGRIVAERYGEGFAWDTPLLGWSMTKTVTAAIIGKLVGDGMLTLDQDGLFEAWDGDDRSAITIADLLAMSSGLEFNEDYGSVTDVTRMLYLEPDMAAFAADKPQVAPRGQRFSYSSGTTVLLSRIWQEAFADPAAALAWPRSALFGPLAMTSAVLEADARGTFAGSSYLYATARDWARFGEFLRNDGMWNGERLLPEGFVSWMREPAPASGGSYGRGHLWLRGPGGEAAGVPADTFWLSGHDGQSVAVSPSQRLVVVRLGLTPSWIGFRPQRLVGALAAALQ